MYIVDDNYTLYFMAILPDVIEVAYENEDDIIYRFRIKCISYDNKCYEEHFTIIRQSIDIKDYRRDIVKTFIDTIYSSTNVREVYKTRIEQRKGLILKYLNL